MDKEQKTNSKIVKTYAEDMVKAIADSQGGVIRKIIHEQEANEVQKKELSPESKKNKFFMLLSLIFVFLACTILFFFYFRTEVNTVEPEKQFTPIIFSDKSTFAEIKGLKKEEIVQTILNKVNGTTVKKGELEGVYLTEDKKVVGLREFINLMKATFVPGAPVFVNDNFLMGVVNKENKDFFILIKVRSTADVFEPLRAWESKMFTELQGFTGVTISADTKYLLTKEFQDGVVQNKNARVLYDNNNQIVLMYVLANDDSVIITKSESAIRELLIRLEGSKVKK